MTTTSPQAKSRPFIGTFGGILALLLGIVVLGFGVLAPWVQALERQQWKELSCEITHATMVEEIRQEQWGNGTRDIVWYVPKVEYTYHAPAIGTSTGTNIADPAPAFRDPVAAQHLTNQYPVGSTQPCYEDPEDARRVYLDIAPQNPARIPIAISGIILILIGILGLSGKGARVSHATSSALAE